MCSCRITEETATHFLFDCRTLVTRKLSTGNLNFYDKNDCSELIEFIKSSGIYTNWILQTGFLQTGSIPKDLAGTQTNQLN